MVFSTEHQLDLPDEFPSEQMVAFMAAARNVLLKPKMAEAWKEFGGACNLVGWRFRACHEDMQKYIGSWHEHGAAISFEEVYSRERALFGMFCSGISCLESMCYAINALASHNNMLNIPFGEKEQRNCSPARLQALLEKHSKAAILSQELKVLVESDEWKNWVDLRNRMTHRSNLPRVGHGAVGGEPPPAKALDFAATLSTPKIEEGVEFLERMFSWLSQAIKSLLVTGTSFATLP
ncbi:hypothetical protein [Pseudomonas leptonychotis]|uniref:hypothetical protein n=1 Tax=Pseudomonas leptonychotis TaxID=2448482 RepID=UPI0039EFDACF